tara:strand:+ start:1968 stop:3311 length:1344 start_codon:yes stop_codon:yes gene_type:complete
MAYEPSEGLFAGLALVPHNVLDAAKDNKICFEKLMKTARDNLAGPKVLDASDEKTKNGMIAATDIDSATAAKQKAIYADLAAALSAILGARNKKDSIPDNVYLTGNKWHPNVEKFKIEAFGMKDYNSSDVILQFGSEYHGISLKKKPKSQSASPTLINNAFSQYVEGDDLKFAKDMLDDHRIKFFAGVIKEACDDPKLLKGFATKYDKGGKSIADLNPDNLADAKELWNIRVPRVKNNKVENIALINLKSENELADRDGLVRKIDSTGKQEEFRKFVNSKLVSQGNVLNPLYKGFLDIMNRPKVKDKLASTLLNRVLKLSLLDELDTWGDAEFKFYLTEGVGTVGNNMEPLVGHANVVDLDSIIVAIAAYRNAKTTIELNKTETFSPGREAAKVFFTVVKGAESKDRMPILDIELRYKGSFTAYPQFFAGMTKEFKKFLETMVPYSN